MTRKDAPSGSCVPCLHCHGNINLPEGKSAFAFQTADTLFVAQYPKQFDSHEQVLSVLALWGFLYQNEDDDPNTVLDVIADSFDKSLTGVACQIFAFPIANDTALQLDFLNAKKGIQTATVKPPVSNFSEHLRAFPGWHLSWFLDAETLKRFYPVADMLDAIELALPAGESSGNISTVLAELTSNALEHGILQLDSKLKASSEGMLDYYTQREQKLQSLTDATLSISLSYSRSTPLSGAFELEMQDSGRGFDFTKSMGQGNPITAVKGQYYGRGLTLLKSLCSDLQYEKNGTLVKATYIYPS